MDGGIWGSLAAHLPILAVSEHLGCPGGAGRACDAEAVGCPVSILPLGSCGTGPGCRPQPSPSPAGPAARQRPAPGWAPGPWPEDERPVCSGSAGGRGGPELSQAPVHGCVWLHLTGGENFSRNRFAGPSPSVESKKDIDLSPFKTSFLFTFFSKNKIPGSIFFFPSRAFQTGARSPGWGPLAGPPEPPGKWSSNPPPRGLPPCPAPQNPLSWMGGPGGWVQESAGGVCGQAAHREGLGEGPPG